MLSCPPLSAAEGSNVTNKWFTRLCAGQEIVNRFLGLRITYIHSLTLASSNLDVVVCIAWHKITMCRL